MAGDAYFGLVSSSLHCNGANDGTSFPDSSISARSWTRSGAPAPVTKTGTKKFGTAAYYSDGNGYIETAHTADLTLEGDFTFDGWYYCTDTGDYRTVFCAHGTTHSIDARVHGGNITLIIDAGAAIAIATTLNAWHHFEVNRSGSTIRMAHDGTFSGTTYTQAGTFFDGSTSMRVGQNSTYGRIFVGYIDDFRLTKGVARHTSNFSAPTEENADYIGAPVEATLIPMTGEITCFGQEPITIEMVASPLTGSVTVEPSPIEMTLDGVAIEEMTSEFEALVGTSTPMAGELPSVEGSFLLDSANIDGVLAPLTSQIDALNGSIGSLDATMTTLDGDFAGDAWQQATIDIRLTRASASFVGLVGTYATVQGTLPRMKGVLAGSVGNTADIDIELPELDADITVAMGGFPTINMLMHEMRGELR